MPTIRFVKNQPEIHVTQGANLMESLLGAHRPVASSCGGKAVCGKCRLEIIQGHEQLTPVTGAEEIVRERLNIPRSCRLSCQAQVLGDVVVDATYW